MSKKKAKKPKKKKAGDFGKERVNLVVTIAPQHRGKIQAQGRHLQDSESWAQDLPLPCRRGIEMSYDLENRLEYRQQEIRRVAFERCRTFMLRASENGGYSGIPKSFFTQAPERVDIEVNAGLAFVPDE